MSHQPEAAQPGSGEASIPFSAPPRPPSSVGPETVVNPERRGMPAGAGLPSGDSVANRLFPPVGDFAVADEQRGPAGTQLAHFVIEDLIGRGGMGAVFRAVDKRLQRVVALKVLSPEQSPNENAVQRFLNEARASARLDHDNIARVYYVGEQRGLHFIAYEYVTGTNIRDLIQQTGRLDVAEAINYTLQIATALKHISAAGIVHRDIKPSNIIVTPSGRAKLVDLGLARNEPTESADELTVAGTTLGTFDYISPEQAKDPRNVDVRSDIYSLGCTFYQMLTGEPPYPEGTMAAKLYKHGGNEPPDPRQKNRRVPVELAAIVKKMMASQPRRRHASPDEVVRDLMVVAGRMGIATLTPQGLVWTKPFGRRQSGFWERNLSWMATALALVVIVVLLDRFHDRIADKLNRPAATAVKTNDGIENLQGRVDGRPETAATDREEPGEEPAGKPNVGSGNRIEPTEAPRPVAVNVDTPATGEDGLGTRDPAAGAPDSNTGDGQEPAQGIDSQSSPPSATFDGFQTAAVPAPVPTFFSRSRSGQTDSAAPPIAVDTDEEARITILAGGQGAGKTFETLEAACATAEDGNVIVLRYNGRRAAAERPLRIVKKKITIRAAEGYRPVIAFRPDDAVPGGVSTRMITLIDASLDLINVDVEMNVGDDPGAAGQWSLFNLQGAHRIELRGCRMTARIAAGTSLASVVELTSAPADELDRMKMTGGEMPLQKEFEIKVVDSFIRAQCRLFQVAHTNPGRFVIEQSALALDGPLLTVLGESGMATGNADLELTLDHVTCFAGEGLIEWDSGSLPRDVLPVSVSSRNCILSTKADAPLITMRGNTDSDDFRRLLRWNGQKNFYDRFQTFWSISTGFTGPAGPLGFDAWKNQVEDDVDANNDLLIWKRRWWQKPARELELDDFALDRSVEENPAVGGASTGSDAGVNLDSLAGRLERNPTGE